jgi:ankyrin repeat protein
MAQDQKNKQLIDAIFEHRQSLVERLLSDGADPNTRDKKEGRPAVVCATEDGPPAQILHALIKYGADVSAEDCSGVTAIWYAMYHGLQEHLKLLLDADFNAGTQSGNSPNYNGRTPLHAAVLGGHYLGQDPTREHIACIRKLVQCPGIDLEAQDGRGETPFDIALKSRNETCINILRNAIAERKAAATPAEVEAVERTRRDATKLVDMMRAFKGMQRSMRSDLQVWTGKVYAMESIVAMLDVPEEDGVVANLMARMDIDATDIDIDLETIKGMQRRIDAMKCKQQLDVPEEDGVVANLMARMDIDATDIDIDLETIKVACHQGGMGGRGHADPLLHAHGIQRGAGGFGTSARLDGGRRRTAFLDRHQTSDAKEAHRGRVRDDEHHVLRRQHRQAHRHRHVRCGPGGARRGRTACSQSPHGTDRKERRLSRRPRGMGPALSAGLPHGRRNHPCIVMIASRYGNG